MLTELGHPDCRGRTCRMISIDGQRVSTVIEDVIFLGQGKKPHTKLICLQKLRFEDKRIEYRFTYYMEGVKPGHQRSLGIRSVFLLIIPANDLKKLLAAAKKANWPGF